MDKEKSTYYIDKDIAREMRIEAATQGIRFPTEFILFLWEFYKQKKVDTVTKK